MSKKEKILVCGDVKGNFKALFSRVNSINEKSGPFDFLFCVGDFFSDSIQKLEPYKNGSLKVSVPTYILGPNREDHVRHYEDMSGCEICPNVHFLGKHGILTSNGLRIAYLSGLEGGNGRQEATLTQKDATAVRDAAYRNKSGKFVGVDVLLTSEWPQDVTKFDPKAGVGGEGSKVVSWLACQLKPRYHFSGLKNVFYERPPYKNCPAPEDGCHGNAHSTRFIGLASVGNVGKSKWLYAANLTPLSQLKPADLYQSTTDETECPYSGLAKTEDRSSTSQFFYDMTATDEPTPKKKRKLSENDRKKMIDPESCWFCLASSVAEKHLVVSIGEEVYVALAKGGLTPLHVMIVPIKHHACQTKLPKNAIDEVKKYKSALRKYFKTKGCVPVIFERNYKSNHLQLQIVPVPTRLADNLKELFMNASEEQGLNLSEMPDKARLRDVAQPGVSYFYVELPSKEKLFCHGRKNFPINFGRDILASRAVLNMSERVNWRDCIVSKEEEEQLVQKFRSEFEQFDDVS